LGPEGARLCRGPKVGTACTLCGNNARRFKGFQDPPDGLAGPVRVVKMRLM